MSLYVSTAKSSKKHLNRHQHVEHLWLRCQHQWQGGVVWALRLAALLPALLLFYLTAAGALSRLVSDGSWEREELIDALVDACEDEEEALGEAWKLHLEASELYAAQRVINHQLSQLTQSATTEPNTSKKSCMMLTQQPCDDYCLLAMYMTRAMYTCVIALVIGTEHHIMMYTTLPLFCAHVSSHLYSTHDRTAVAGFSLSVIAMAALDPSLHVLLLMLFTPCSGTS